MNAAWTPSKAPAWINRILPRRPPPRGYEERDAQPELIGHGRERNGGADRGSRDDVVPQA